MLLTVPSQWRQTGGTAYGFVCGSHQSCGETQLLTVLDTPHDVCISPDSNLIYVADKNNHRVVVLSPSGERVSTFGTGVKGMGWNQLNRPWGVAIAGSTVYVTDRGNNRVKVRAQIHSCCCLLVDVF